MGWQNSVNSSFSSACCNRSAGFAQPASSAPICSRNFLSSTRYSSRMSAPLLRVDRLTKGFGGLVAGDRISFERRRDEIVGLIGPNGAGKTTLLRLITKILKPDAGSIVFRGADITALRPWEVVERGIAGTFQNTRPFRHLPIIANVMVPLVAPRARRGGEWVKSIEAKAMDALEFVGISDMALEQASALSQGDLKRLEVARAIATEPELLLLDEPLGGNDGELVGVVGPNGAGKSTLLRAISGLVRFEARMKRGAGGDIVLAGEVRFGAERIDGLPAHEIRRLGLVHCPERRRPFRELTVLENLMAGAFLSKSSPETQRRLDRSFALFPRLAERKDQIAGTLSGGEQQMLATARALMYEARLLAIDEPSLGLAPRIREELFAAIRRIHGAGTAVLLVEQEVGQVFRMADRSYVLSHGRIIAQGNPQPPMADGTRRAGHLRLF